MNVWLPWVFFVLLVLALLVLDLGVINRRARAVSLRNAAGWSAAWVTASLVFCAGVYFWRGPEGALQFLTGYVLEKSLSMDNIFVFAVLFGYFAVPAEWQHRVLFWGVLGALAMRAIFILAGIELLTHFHWFLYVFGAFLLISGAHLLRSPRRRFDPARNRMLQLTRKLLPITEQYEGAAFFARRSGRLMATPLFVVLLLIETTDVIFAADSIPAVLSVTQDPFVVYTSNVFAVLGLRALYFLLAGIIERFRYLHAGLSLVLIFVGAKMLVLHWFRIPTHIALLIILGILTLTVLASLHAEKPGKELLPKDTRPPR